MINCHFTADYRTTSPIGIPYMTAMAKHCVNDSVHMSMLGLRRRARVSRFPECLEASMHRNAGICLCSANGAISLVKVQSRSKDRGEGAESATSSHQTIDVAVVQVDAVSDVTLTTLSSL